MMKPVPALAASVMVVGVIAFGSTSPSFAQQAPTKDDIVRKLQPGPDQPRTRSLRRGVTVTKGKKKAGKPSIDLNINFEFNSDRLGTDAQISLNNLGRALADPRLKGYKFLIAGHTDAAGADAYNLELSQRRANSVRTFLVTRYRIDPSRLSIVGHGERKLLDPANPRSAANRRVQIVNVGSGS